MKLTITGEILYIHAVEHRGNYKKRLFGLVVIPEDKQKGVLYGITANNNDAFILNDFEPEDVVEVTAQLNGYMYNAKIINNITLDSIRMVKPTGSDRNKRYQDIQKEKKKTFFD